MRILIMAGGTGGHVFPAVAIAKRLEQDGHEILWLGTRGRMEERLVPKAGFSIEYIKVKGIRRNGLKAKLLAPFMIIRAVMQALSVISRFKPDVVLGMGGYASGPGGVAAKISGVPLVLHEQNAAAGLTNRLLSRIADKILLGFPGAFTGKNVINVGNPVRVEIASLHDKKRLIPSGPLRVLVIGGSLGAQALNREIPKAMALFGKDEITITHQCGAGRSAEVSQAYSDCCIGYEVCDFIDDMTKAYTSHDLIICRAGASTVAECACAGIPAIFVPLPSAVDDHQTKNANFLVSRGAALLCPQSQLNAESLSALLCSLIKDRSKLEAMSAKAKDCAVMNADIKAASIIESIKVD